VTKISVPNIPFVDLATKIPKKIGDQSSEKTWWPKFRYPENMESFKIPTWFSNGFLLNYYWIPFSIQKISLLAYGNQIMVNIMNS